MKLGREGLLDLTHRIHVVKGKSTSEQEARECEGEGAWGVRLGRRARANLAAAASRASSGLERHPVIPKPLVTDN